MPIFWSEEELSWMEGSYLLKQVQDRLNNIAEDYDEIAAVRGLQGHPWSRGCVRPACSGLSHVGVDAFVGLVGQAAPEWKQFTMEEFKWARMMVASRNFGVNVRGHVSVAVARNCVRATRDSP